MGGGIEGCICDAVPLVPGTLATPGAPAVDGGGGSVEVPFSAMFST